MPDDPPYTRDQFVVTDKLARLRRFTPARIALGRAGSGQLTATGLRFLLDHARARDAVHAALDFGSIGQSLRERDWSVVHVRSAATDRGEYLRRPDLGRRLSPAGRLSIDSERRCNDVVIVAADGLSASAIEINLQPLLDHLRRLLLARGLTIGPLVLVEQGRVAIGDEIGELLGAKLVIVLIGERPGLSAAELARCLYDVAAADRHDGFEPQLHIQYSSGWTVAGRRGDADRRPDRASVQACRDGRPTERFAGSGTVSGGGATNVGLRNQRIFLLVRIPPVFCLQAPPLPES